MMFGFTDADVEAHASRRLSRVLARQYGIGVATLSSVHCLSRDGESLLDVFDRGEDALLEAYGVGPIRSAILLRAYQDQGAREGLLKTSRFRLVVRMWVLRMAAGMVGSAWLFGTLACLGIGAPWWAVVAWPLGCLAVSFALVAWVLLRWT